MRAVSSSLRQAGITDVVEVVTVRVNDATQGGVISLDAWSVDHVP
jgi:hypothetical protein